jgi:hypothetical protein
MASVQPLLGCDSFDPSNWCDHWFIYIKIQCKQLKTMAGSAQAWKCGDQVATLIRHGGGTLHQVTNVMYVMYVMCTLIKHLMHQDVHTLGCKRKKVHQYVVTLQETYVR